MLGDDDRVTSGVWDLSTDEGQAKGMRFAFMRRKLLALETVERLFYERSMHLKGEAILVHHGLVAIIEEWAAVRGIKVEHFKPTEVKIHIAGKGNAEKPAIADVVRKRFGLVVPIESYDQTDALGVLATGLDLLAGKFVRKAKKPKPKRPALVAATRKTTIVLNTLDVATNGEIINIARRMLPTGPGR